jgi:hypothetical protein
MDSLGDILYNGPYNPKSTGLGFANESFTVELPSLNTGDAILSVTHLSLVEVGLSYQNFRQAKGLTSLGTGWTTSFSRGPERHTEG